MKTRLVLVLALVAAIAASSSPASARGSKPQTFGAVNTNYRPDQLPGGFKFLDGTVLTAPTYVTSLCNMTTLLCVVQPPSQYAGKAYFVQKDGSGKWVPKQ